MKVTEEFSGTNHDFYYLPYVTDMSPVQSKIDITGRSSVPSMNFTVWDNDRELSDKFKGVNYEASQVEVGFYDSDDNLEGTFKGILTDVSFEESQIDFTVRGEESKDIESFFEFFNYDTFQYFNIFSFKNVELEPIWNRNYEGIWEMAEDFSANPRSDFQNVAIESMKSFCLEPLAVGDSKVVLTTKTNKYNKYVYNPSQEKMERDGVSHTLFDDPGAGTAEAWIGQPNSHNFEKIRYGGLNLNGTTGFYELTDVETTGDYKIKHDHLQGTPIIPIKATEVRDVIWVKANGFLPYEGDDNINFKTGFIDVGELFFLGDSPISNSERPVTLYRYEIETGGVVNDFIKLKIHNNPKNPDHDLAFDNPLAQSCLPWPGKLDSDNSIPFSTNEGSRTHTMFAKVSAALGRGRSDWINEFAPERKVRLVSFEWIVKSMDMMFDNFGKFDQYDSLETDVFKNDLKRAFDNRLRGVRIDMLEDQSEFMDVLSNNFDEFNPQQAGEVNEDLLNNASGKFGVVAESEIIFGSDENDIYEKVYFNLPQDAGGRWVKEVNDDDTTDNSDIENTEVFNEDENGNLEKIGNYLTFKRQYINREELAGDGIGIGKDDAENYFLNKKYRGIFEPVPENSQDLGKFFPIVYGHVEKAPMLHVISKKTFFGDENFTAGDDVYIFAAHPCSIEDESDIVIHWIPNSENTSNQRRNGVEVYHSTAKNPFPNRLENHYREVVDPNGNTVVTTESINYPYHRLDTFKTLDEKTLYGIRLQGAEWNHELGTLDKRYAIRNGLGSSTLYATFSGYLDDDLGSITGESQSLIQHPLHILEHFVKNYGVHPFSEDVLDEENIKREVARTSSYRASVFLSIPEELNFSTIFTSLTEDICKQFGYFKFRKDGVINFKSDDFDYVDYSKPLSEGLNVMNEVQEVSEGYKEIYTKIIYRYKKNWHTGGYDGVIELNKSNNEHCLKASESKGQQETFEIDADFVNSGYIARVVANKYARRLCKRRIRYSLSIKDTGLDFEPGDYVPLTYTPLGLKNTPVLITSVVEDGHKIDLEVLELIDP